MEETDSGSKGTGPLSVRLKGVLKKVHNEECPFVPNPPGCKKRAAVALVIRIRPPFSQEAVFDQQKCSSSSQTFQASLDNFFSQSWVQHGDPEVLFIKRAARAGDRWTSHIAFPGGKRDPGDSDDRATSVRETMEEIGLDLNANHSLFIGNLPERVLRMMWGETPLMVLCPYVYLMMCHDLPPLALQPSEIHSAHWVPMRGLLTPLLRRSIRCDVSERLTRPYARLLIRAIAGQMVFGAVKLKPTESLYCSSLPGYIPDDGGPQSFSRSVGRILNSALFGGEGISDADDQPLLLWGLTLGIVADILELIDLKGTSKLWSWPTLSPWDIRFTVWLLTYKFRSRKLRELTTMTGTPGSNEVRIGGLDNTTFTTSTTRRSQASEAGVAAMQLLDGYAGEMRKAVVVALFLRFSVGASFAAYLIRKYRSSRL